MNSIKGAITLEEIHRLTHPMDRRKCSRSRTEAMIRYLPVAETEHRRFRKARLVDISTSGIGLIVPEPMERDEQFIVKLLAGGLVPLIYTSRHCGQLGPARYRVGACLSGYIGSVQQNDPNWLFELFHLAATDQHN